MKGVYYKTGGIALLLLILDRIMKILSSSWEEGIFLFKGTFFQIGLKLSHNSNLAFSIKFPNLAIIFIASLFILVLIYFFARACKNDDRFTASILLFILLGAFSNIFDRIFYGHVIDYIYVSFYSMFNIADAMIVLPALAWLWKIARTK